MRLLVALLVVLVAVPVALAGLAVVAELPGERAIKERLGFEYDDFPYGVCNKVPGVGQQGSWRAETPLRVQQDEARAVAVGDSVYIAGGVGLPKQGTGTTLARFERYDITTRRYERLPDIPIAVDHTGIAEHDGAIYVIGGHTTGGGDVLATNRVFRYVIATRRWEELASMAEPRGGHGVAVIGDRIYVVGGRPNRTFDRSVPSVALVEAFDTRTGRWSRETTMPDPRDHIGVAALGGKIYVYGGREPGGRTRERLDRYDPVTHAWTRLADAPVGTSGIDLLAGDGILYTAGGEVPLEGRVLGGAWVYQVDADRWEETTALPGPRHGYASVIDGGRLYLFGGSTCPGLYPTRVVVSRPFPS
jgi:N-acetylneuraminic acid mutarotase